MATLDRAAGLHDLFRRAYGAARESNPHSGDVMTIAVLKNRLLDLTGRSFDQRDYGFERFIDLVASLGDLMSLDRTTTPPLVRLKGGTEPTTEARMRIRHDLWQAVVDYSSGQSYVWDEGQSRGRPRRDDDGDELPELPTVTPEQVKAWRQEFVNANADRLDSAEARERLARWVDVGLGTRFLPPELRGVWNRTLRDKTTQHLTAWFESNHIQTPPDLVAVPAGPAPSGTRSDAEAQRSFVHDVVAAMSREELDALLLPVSAVIRVKRKRH